MTSAVWDEVSEHLEYRTRPAAKSRSMTRARLRAWHVGFMLGAMLALLGGL